MQELSLCNADPYKNMCKMSTCPRNEKEEIGHNEKFEQNNSNSNKKYNLKQRLQ